MKDGFLMAFLAVLAIIWVVCVYTFPIPTLAVTVVGLVYCLWSLLKAISGIFRR